MIGKKGLSSVVATVLLVSVTIAAVVLLAGFLFPFTKNLWKSGTECYGYMEYYVFDDENGLNCYELNSGEYKYAISVSADSSDEELDQGIMGLDLAFTKDGSVVTERVKEGFTVEGNFRMINPSETAFKIPRGGESFTYVYLSNIDFESVSIYPVLKSEKRCDKTDTVSIRNMVCENEIP